MAGTRGSNLLFCGLPAIGLPGSHPTITTALRAFLRNSFCVLRRSPIRTTHLKRGFLDDLAQRVQMLERFFGGSVRKDDGELFTAASESLAVATDLSEPLGHHAQHLVADIVPVGVVELLEMVDVDDGDGVLLVE